MVMKIALTGGGTGGHIYPCLAIAEYFHDINLENNLSERLEDSIKGELGATIKNKVELFYIGQPDKLEGDLVINRHPYIKFLPIKTSSPSKAGWNPFNMLSWLWEFTMATQACKDYIRNNNIEVLFGTGGYASGPAFAAAILTKTPYIIHNLDASIGLANKVFIKDAQAATLAFPVKHIKPKNGNVLVAGNPVSKEFFSRPSNNSSRPVSDSQFASIINKNDEVNILITGGSQGSKNLNDTVGEIIPNLISKTKVTVTHITGAKLYDEYLMKYMNGDPGRYSNYTVLPYTHTMPQLCKEADIAICRSGAMTIAEMAASNTVPLFIPLPWAAHNHQVKNAESLANADAAIMIEEKDLSPEVLKNRIYELITDEDKLDELKTNLQNFSKPTAARNLAELIVHVAQNK